MANKKKKYKKEEIIAYVKFICDMLEIEFPEVKFKNNDSKHHFSTNTTLAVLVTEENTIYINHTISTLEIFFVIAHELRHLYQFTYYPKWFKGYLTSDHATSTEEYNLQFAEIDANAFAKIIMEAEFGISLSFNSLPVNVNKRINQRAEEILPEYYEKRIISEN